MKPWKWRLLMAPRLTKRRRHAQIDTPDLNFVLEAGDEGFVAKICAYGTHACVCIWGIWMVVEAHVRPVVLL